MYFDASADGLPRGEADIPAATKIVYGPEASFTRLPAEIDALGAKRAFIVTGKSMATTSDLIRRLTEALAFRCAGVFDGMGQHSPRSTVVAAASAATAAGADLLIGVGGGSSVVGTKGVALVMGEGENLENLKSRYDNSTASITVPPLLKPKPPVIAIPTTLSSGEFSSAMGITDDATGRKDIFIDPKIVPKIIVLDPVMTTATPSWLWASTGVKALQNAIERYYARNHHPFIDGLCLEAIRLVFRYLETSVRDSSDLEARGNLQFLNWMTAFGAGKGGIGLGHGICHQLGGVCHVPHGISGCIVLPHTMAFNLPFTAARQKNIAVAMGLDVTGLSDENAGYAAADRVRQLVVSLRLPTRLRDVGVRQDTLWKVAEMTLLDRTLAPTPRRPVDAKEVFQLLEQMY
jgi:alcohol dehydrogenase class IV